MSKNYKLTEKMKETINEFYKKYLEEINKNIRKEAEKDV